MLSFIESGLQSGPQLGGKRGRRPPKQKFRPPKLPACPPKIPLPLQLFEDGGVFDWKSTENSAKSRPLWCDAGAPAGGAKGEHLPPLEIKMSSIFYV